MSAIGLSVASLKERIISMGNKIWTATGYCLKHNFIEIKVSRVFLNLTRCAVHKDLCVVALRCHPVRYLIHTAYYSCEKLSSMNSVVS